MSSPIVPNFTPSQLDAIRCTDRGVIVSAAAGSGKTATLAERVAHLVASKSATLDSILVLTFTENAAAEMRARIESVLLSRANESAHIHEQSLLVPRAPISTIHGFCSRLIREHFQQLGLDPAFTVLDESEAAILRSEALRTVLDRAHLRNEKAPADRGGTPGDFALALEYLGGGDDETLGQLILQLHLTLSSEIAPADWRSRALHRLEEAAKSPTSCDVLKDLGRIAAERVGSLLTRAEALATACDQVHPGLAEPIRAEFIPVLKQWMEQLDGAGVLGLKDTAPDFKRAKSVATDDPRAKILKGARDSLRKAIKQGPLPGGLPVDSAMWAQAAKSSLPLARVLLTLSDEFDTVYRAEKDARNQLDFSDLERFALRLLRREDATPSDIAVALQERFHHVLVDESQDINAMQDTLLSLVSRDRSSQASNLFSVGDIKQSIYRFRLAEPALFSGRRAAYESLPARGKVILLKENFRTRKPLIGAINAVFSRLMVGGGTEINYADGQELVFGADYYTSPPESFIGAPIELHLIDKPARPHSHGGADGDANDQESSDDNGDTDDSADTDNRTPATTPDTASPEELERIELEAQLIARRIRQLMGLEPDARGVVARRQVYDKVLARANPADAGSVPTRGMRPIRYGDIAILLRSATYKARQLSAILQRSGIPVHADARGGLLELQEVRDVLAVLDLLDNPKSDLALVTFLRSPLSSCRSPEESLATVRTVYRDCTLAEAVRQFLTTETHSPAHADLAGAIGQLARWREVASRLTVADTLERIFAETHYLTHLVGLLNGPQKVANVTELLGRASDYCDRGNRDVSGFVASIRRVESETELDQPAIAAGEDDVVRVMTIHKSKGLEFPVVFVPDLAKAFNTRDESGNVLMGRQSLLAPKACDVTRRALYPSPAWLIARHDSHRQMLAEELRVLYVAFTRAREHLILVASESPSAVAKAQCLYGRDMPLTPFEVLDVRNALQWVLMSIPDSPELLLTTNVPADDLTAPAAPPDPLTPLPTTAGDPAQPAILPPAPLGVPDWLIRRLPAPGQKAGPAERGEPHALAESIVDRIGWVYPQSEAANRPAAISVTALTHRPPEAPAAPPPSPTAIEPGTPATDPADNPEPDLLRVPRFLASDTLGLAATERGTATHIALEHFDFAAIPAPSARDIAEHIQRLVDRRILTDSEAAAIEPACFTFLASSSLAPLLRGERGRLVRELPIYLPRPLDPASSPALPPDPMDRQMIRGRIDLLVDTPEGPVIIDYKTDHVWGDRLAERIEQYRGQVELYRSAATALLGRPCAGVYLAFVHPRARHIAKL